MLKYDHKFEIAVDRFILRVGDEELLRQIRKIDEQAQKLGISFYEGFYEFLEILYKAREN